MVAGREVDGWSPRLLLVLIERLPEGSEFHAELQGSRDYRDYQTTDWLLIVLINAVIANSEITVKSAGGKLKKPFEPFTGPTPETVRPLEGAAPKAKKMATLEDAQRFFEKMMGGLPPQ